MAQSFKPVQVQGSASVSDFVTLYSTGSGEEAIISSLLVCNSGSAAATYRVGLAGSAGSPSASNWLVYDASVDANDTTALTLGVCLDSERFIRVSSSASTVVFSAFVTEVF
jgi:hypothetical protein